MGRYRAEVNGQTVTMEVLMQNASLAVRLPDERIFELLEPNEEGRWVFALTDQAAISFECADNHLATSMRFHQAGTALELQRGETDG